MSWYNISVSFSTFISIDWSNSRSANEITNKAIRKFWYSMSLCNISASFIASFLIVSLLDFLIVDLLIDLLVFLLVVILI